MSEKSIQVWKKSSIRVFNYLLDKLNQNSTEVDGKFYVDSTNENQLNILAISEVAGKNYSTIIDFLLDTNPENFKFDLRTIEITKIQEWFADGNA